MNIKFCGITRNIDYLIACVLKVKYTGFILTKQSPRYISLEEIKFIIDIKDYFSVPFQVTHLPLKVGVVVNFSLQELQDILEENIFDILQFHGEESNKMLTFLKSWVIDNPKISKKVLFWKVFRIKSKKTILKAKEYNKSCDAFLLDTYSKKSYGGTGKIIEKDWLIPWFSQTKPIILAGGVSTKNVAYFSQFCSLIECIDINSGIEKLPGIKEHDKMIEIIASFNELNVANKREL